MGAKGFDWQAFIETEPVAVGDDPPDSPVSSGEGADWGAFLDTELTGAPFVPDGTSGTGSDWGGFLQAEPDDELLWPESARGPGSDWTGFLSAAFTGQPFEPSSPGSSEGGFDWGGFLFITPEGFVQFSPTVFGRLLMTVDNATGAVDLILPPQTGQEGRVLVTNGSTVSWGTFSSELGGTVTSVGLSAPDIFSVSNSPVSVAGTIALGLVAQDANTIWAGPATGAAATPSFRGLVAGDIPDLSATYQPKDADLTAIAALTTDAFGRVLLTKTDGAAVRSYIGAGTSSFSGAYADLSGLPDLTVYAALAGANVFTNVNTINLGALADLNTEGLMLVNDALTTAEAPLQNAPLIVFEAHGWDELNEADTKWEMNEKFFQGFNDSAGVTARFSWEFSRDEGPYVEKVYIDSSGSIGAIGYVTGLSFSPTGGGIFNQSTLTLNSSQAYIQNSSTSGPLLFSSSNIDNAPAWQFAAPALTSANGIEFLGPNTGFTGSYLKIGRSSNGTSVTTSILELAANGNLTIAGVFAGNGSGLTNLVGDDAAYDATSWNGNTGVPTKNAVRDKFETFGALATVTPGTGIATWLATPTVANFKAALSDETTVVGNLLSLANPSAISFIKIAADNTVSSRTPAQVKTDLAIAAGDVSGLAASATTDTTNATNISSGTLNAARIPDLSATYQPTDADLTSWAAVTRASGFDTFTATPTLANLKALLTDETTVGWNLFTLANPTAIRFLRINADNTVDALSDTDFRTAIGAGTGGGSVTSFSAGDLSPLFTTSEATVTTTPVLTFALSNAAAHTIFGNFTGSAAAPSYNVLGTGVDTALGVNVGSAGAFVTFNGALGTPSSGTLTNCTFPTLNQNTTGSAASLSISGQTGLLTFTGLASTSRVKTVRDAADTILELGGSYTPTGTWTNMTLVTPALGTPASGVVTNLTGTASININGTVGATTPSTGVFTTLVAGSTTSLLLGTAGSAVGNIGFRNATSGTVTLAPPTGALGTYTITLPNAASTMPIFPQQITFTGPTAARTVTFPDANFTVASLAGTEELTNKTLNAAVGKGTWTASGTWTLPSLTLSGTVSGTPTWASNQAITLSTAAQPNITSLGTLTTLSVIRNDASDTTITVQDTNSAGTGRVLISNDDATKNCRFGICNSTRAADGVLLAGDAYFYSSAAAVIYATGAIKMSTGGNTQRVNIDTSGNVQFNAYAAGEIISDGSGNLTSAGAAATSATTGTMTVTMTKSVHTITPTGACTFNASGGVAGQRCTFYITTSGVSSFVLTWGTNFKTIGTLATGTTTAKVFTVSFVCKDGTTWAETGRTTAM